MKTVTLLKYCRCQEFLGIAAVTLLFLPLGSMVANVCHTAPGVEQGGEMRVVSPQQDPAAWWWYLTVRGYGETDKDWRRAGFCCVPHIAMFTEVYADPPLPL